MPPELHPLAQKYPPMEAEEFAAFQADLAEHGQKNPIWLFEGKVLDGRNRLRACTELGIDPVFAEFTGSEAEAAAFVDSQNLHRRHLNKEWRQKLALEMRSEGRSTREIARELGCHRRTVERDLTSGGGFASPEPPTRETASTEASVAPVPTKHGPIPGGAFAPPDPPKPSQPVREPPRVKGRDGKSYPAKLPASTKPKPAPQVKAPQPSTATKTKPAPKEKAQWAELATILGDLAEKVETLVPTPEENEKPWELISSLEKTAQALNRQAQRLRRRHHL